MPAFQGSRRRDRLDRTNFYVYSYAYPDGTVFYIGKGCNGRINQHEYEARGGHQCKRCEAIRSIWAQGGQVIKRKEYENLSEAVAYQLEAQCIEERGLSTLVNGQCGHKIDRWQ